MKHQISRLPLRTAESAIDISACYIRLCPSGVPTESNPLLSLDICTENANSVRFAYLRCTSAALSWGSGSLFVAQEARPISPESHHLGAVQAAAPAHSSRPSCTPAASLRRCPAQQQAGGWHRPPRGWEWEVAGYKYLFLNTSFPLFRETEWCKLSGQKAVPWLTAEACCSFVAEEPCWQQMAAPASHGCSGAAPASGIYQPGLMQCAEWFQMGRGDCVPAEISSSLVNV